MKKRNPKSRRSARVIKAKLQKSIVQPTQLQSAISKETTAEHIVAYDENLLECARLQWHMGDWISLVKIDRATLQHHPDRAKLALLVAAAHQQTNQQQTAAHFVRLALDWGCSKKLIAQLLIAGVHNTLGRASLLSKNDFWTQQHFTAAVQSDESSIDIDLLAHTRTVREAAQIGLLPQAAQLLQLKLDEVLSQTVISERTQAHIAVLQTEVELLHHELSLAQQRQQLKPSQASLELPQPGEMLTAIQLELLKNKAVSQLGQDIWVLDKTGYKRNGFFVEFGATDGVLLSNTWLLEKQFGWRGLCAEPNPKFFEQLKKNRNCIVSDACIAEETGRQVDFILADVYGGIAEYADQDNHSEKRAAYQAIGQSITLSTLSLHDFLIRNNAPREIDYISIDTEGSELAILSSFPFELWRVKLFTVEHNYTIQREGIAQLMAKNGYQCVEKEWDDWFFLEN